MFHFYNIFINMFNISSPFSGGIIISSTFLEFPSGFTILWSFDLVTTFAILFPKNSPALWITFLEAVFTTSGPVPNNCFFIFYRK